MAYSIVDVEQRKNARPHKYAALPSRETRERLKKGDKVQVLFVGNDRSTDILWVTVDMCFAAGEGYRGVVASPGKSRELPEVGDSVTFGPEHVLGVDPGQVT